MEERIVRLLEEHGPKTGYELREALGDDGFGQWKACMCSDRIVVHRVGRRYLRLDQKVEGYARLSPSILREFLTYSVVGLSVDRDTLEARTRQLADHIAVVNAGKLRLAQRVVGEIGGKLLEAQGSREERFCVLLAGDIIYGMGHDAARPEHCTGRMVRGSDLDLVIILDDHAPEELGQKLDDAIYQEKHRRLINPSSREEIDYTIKPLARVREQVASDTFRHMVPCKILHESVLLYGSQAVYDAARGLLAERQISEKLAALPASAGQPSWKKPSTV